MQQGFDFNENDSFVEHIDHGAVLLKGFAKPVANQLLAEEGLISQHSPYRHMTTPGGGTMSVAITNCGSCGWVSDQHGYRYEQRDPLTEAAWPQIPESFLTICKLATQAAGFEAFTPDACLLNKYQIGTKMGLHNDNDEHDLRPPIVSVSLGLDAVFLFGSKTRQSPAKTLLLNHGDVVVFGGKSRLNYHGISRINASSTADNNMNYRLNLTFRKVY
jgi:alkylated DNA repair protein (DNA oxidative demethylase)